MATEFTRQATPWRNTTVGDFSVLRRASDYWGVRHHDRSFWGYDAPKELADLAIAIVFALDAAGRAAVTAALAVREETTDAG